MTFTPTDTVNYTTATKTVTIDVAPAATTPNDGSHPWTLPSASSTQCLVRVSDASNAAIFDVSNAVLD